MTIPHTITSQLKPVRLRRRLMRALRGMMWGAAVGAITAMVLHRLGLSAGLMVLAAAPLIGAITGAMRHESWAQAAAAVDAHGALKDRVTTALAFSQLSDTTPLHQLAIVDAVEHLRHVDARRVTPLCLPRLWGLAAALFAVAWVVVLWPARGDQAHTSAPTQPIPRIVAEGQRLENDLTHFESLAREMDDMSLVELAAQLRDAAEEIKQPGVDVKDALATMSRMQTMLRERQAAFNLEAVDALLADLGEALALDDATAQAGRALKRGDYRSAADLLEGADNPATNEQTTAALNELADAMRQQGLDELADETARMAEAIEQRDKAGFHKSRNTMAAQVRRHAQRHALAAQMRERITRLSESKSAAATYGNHLASGRSHDSSPDASNNPPLDAAHRGEPITGQLGDGPMHSVTMISREAGQVAKRDYREVYADYRKLSEAVVESEAIPLGHRQTIRRYFEAIRPEEVEEKGLSAD
jgi:hypothetical protein